MKPEEIVELMIFRMLNEKSIWPFLVPSPEAGKLIIEALTERGYSIVRLQQ